MGPGPSSGLRDEGPGGHSQGRITPGRFAGQGPAEPFAGPGAGGVTL
jgi:hypothetical protein